MPKKLEEKLRELAEEHSLSGDAKKSYIYGTMHKIEEKKESKKKEKKEHGNPTNR